MEGTGISTGEALLLNDRRDNEYGFGGGYWFWFIIIIFFFMQGGYGFGNRGVAAEGIATRAAVTDGFQFNTLDNGIRAIQNGICQSTYDLTTAIKDCCCNLNRSVDSVRYDMSRGFCDVVNAGNLNTRDILENQNAGVQKILDYMCDNEKQALRQEISALQLSAVIQQQTQNLVGQLLPRATPAYLTCSPYQSMAGYGCGYPYAANGCGCGI